MPGNQLSRHAGHGTSLLTTEWPTPPFILPRQPADITVTASQDIIHLTTSTHTTTTVPATTIISVPSLTTSMVTVERLITVPTTITVFPTLERRDDKTVTVTPPTVYKTTILRFTRVLTSWKTIATTFPSLEVRTTTVDKSTLVPTTVTAVPSAISILQTLTIPPSGTAKESQTTTRSLILPLASGSGQNSTATISDVVCARHNRLHWLHIAIAFFLGALILFLLQKAWAFYRRWRANRTGKGYIDRKPLFKRTGLVGDRGDIPLESVSAHRTGATEPLERRVSGHAPSVRESLSQPPPAYVPRSATLPEARRDEHGFWADFKS